MSVVVFTRCNVDIDTMAGGRPLRVCACVRDKRPLVDVRGSDKSV